MSTTMLYDELGRSVGTITILCVCNPTEHINKQRGPDSLLGEPDYGIALYNETVIPVVYEESIQGWQIWELGTQLLFRKVFKNVE